jgi:hypothetical protein
MIDYPPVLQTSTSSNAYLKALSSPLPSFCWKQDYARRALDLVQDLLLSLFEPASSDGAVPPLPAPSVPFKPYLDAYDLLHLAVTHHDALQVRHTQTIPHERRRREIESECGS